MEGHLKDKQSNILYTRLYSYCPWYHPRPEITASRNLMVTISYVRLPGLSYLSPKGSAIHAVIRSVTNTSFYTNRDIDLLEIIPG